MAQQWLIIPCLIGLLSLSIASRDSFANDAKRLQDRQKMLNDEVLSQPFSVPDAKQLDNQKAKAKALLPPSPQRSRSTVYPSLGVGWYFSNHHHRYGLRHHYGYGYRHRHGYRHRY